MLRVWTCFLTDFSPVKFYSRGYSWTWSLQNCTDCVMEEFKLLFIFILQGGEHGPTDYIHNVALPCCRVLHQSCTRAFIIIFTWESTESCIWSTIIPAQVLVLKRDIICIDAQVWNISTAPWSYKEENGDFFKESFGVVHVELIEKFERSVTSWVADWAVPPSLNLLCYYFAHEEKIKFIENEVSWYLNKKREDQVFPSPCIVLLIVDVTWCVRLLASQLWWPCKNCHLFVKNQFENLF